MRRKLLFIKTALVVVLFFTINRLSAQKIFNEGSLVYDIAVQTGSTEPKMADMFDGATTTIYFKGSQSRSELVSGLGSEVNIYDSKTGNGVILKGYSGQKLMFTLTRDDWEKINRKYDGITFETTNETKVIAGYNAVKAIAKLKDGTSFTVYYTQEINVSNKDYAYQFKTLPGLALQYELQSGKMKFTFTVSKISFDPVAVSKFDIPKSGYRVMTYDEQQKLKTVN